MSMPLTICFFEIIQNAFNQAFCLTRLSRKRLHDKKWIIKKSSIMKNKLYKQWLISQNIEDEIIYKQYRNIFKEAAAAENAYYQ